MQMKFEFGHLDIEIICVQTREICHYCFGFIIISSYYYDQHSDSLLYNYTYFVDFYDST